MGFMKDKEKQIEEMEQFIYDYVDSKQTEKVYLLSSCVNELAKPFVHNKGIAEALYNAGYRKIPEDSVVLSREEYNDYLNLKDLLDKGYFTSENRVAIHKTRKETAENILNSLLIEVKALDDYESVGKFDILGWLEELAKQFGVEIKE